MALVLIASTCNGSDDNEDAGTDSGTDQPTPVSSPVPCTAPTPIPDQLDDVRELVSNTLVPDWQSARHDDRYQANRCYHNWTTDDCSAPGIGSTGLSYDFTHPCHRHDFGYRNFKRLEAETAMDTWNEVNKLAVDDALLSDAREHCSGRRFYLKTQCYGWAQVYYWAVRAFG